MGYKSKLNLLVVLLFAFTLVQAQEQIRVIWNPSTDNVGVEGYNVWIDAEYHGTTKDTSFVFTLEPGTFMIAASAFDAVGNESDLSVPLLLDIQDTDSPTTPHDLMEVYPNPSYGAFNIQFNEDLYASTLLIYTPTGKLVYERNLPDGPAGHIESLDISEFPEQPYVIVLQRNEERIGKTHITVS